jgi:PAS domain S-box-containing protein
MTHEFRNITRPLRNQYLFFLGIILITIVTNQVIIRYNIQKNNQAASIINTAGRQRMLSQRISKLVYNVTDQIKCNENINPALLDSLTILIAQFKNAHQALSTGNGYLAITTKPSVKVKSMLDDNIPGLDSIVTAANNILKTQNVETADASIETLRQNDVQFLLQMEKTVAMLEIEYEESQEKINKILTTLTTVSILAILLSFILIFLPTIRKLRTSNELLTKATDRLFLATGAGEIGVWEYEVATDKLLWDDEMYKLYGLSPENFNGLLKSWFKTIHPDDVSRVVKELRSALHGKEEINTEFKIVLHDGTVRYIRAQAASLYNRDGKVVRLTGINMDITHQRVAEKKLQESKEVLAKAQQIAKMGSWEWDIKTGEEHWSDEQYRIFGLEPNGVPVDYELFASSLHPDDEAKVNKAIADALAGIKNYEIDFRIISKQGGIKHVEARGEVYRDANGKPEKMVGTVLDITEKKLLQTDLVLREEQFRSAFEYSAIGMAIVSLEGKWLRVNKQICDIVGYTEKELLALTFQELTHPDDLNNDIDNLKKIIAGDIDTYQMEKRYLHKNGSIVWVLLNVSLVRDEEGNPFNFISQIEDITQRKKDQTELLRSNQELTALFDSGNHVSTISTDLNGTINYFSKGAETLLGYTADEMVNKHSPAIIHKKEEVEKRGNELSEKFGKEIRGFDVFVEYAKQGQYESREWTYVKKSGEEFAVQLVVTAIKNDENKIVGFLGIATDISWQKEKEKELRESLDIIGEQNKRLLNFAHIVSHNLRSHSGNIAMLLNLYDDADDPEEKEEMVGHLKGISGALSESIKNLNEVVSIQTNINKQREKLNLNKYIAKTIEILSGDINLKNGQIINNVPDDVEVDFNAAYMESVLLNFLSNGIKYKHPDRPPVVTIDALHDDGKLVLQIADNGLGIDMGKYGDKLFGMYKTFHGNSDAKGIGLFITKNQVEAMGGKIEVESEVNKGTTFKIFLK